MHNRKKKIKDGQRYQTSWNNQPPKLKDVQNVGRQAKASLAPRLKGTLSQPQKSALKNFVEANQVSVHGFNFILQKTGVTLFYIVKSICFGASLMKRGTPGMVNCSTAEICHPGNPMQMHVNWSPLFCC